MSLQLFYIFVLSCEFEYTIRKRHNHLFQTTETQRKYLEYRVEILMGYVMQVCYIMLIE